MPDKKKSFTTPLITVLEDKTTVDTILDNKSSTNDTKPLIDKNHNKKTITYSIDNFGYIDDNTLFIRGWAKDHNDLPIKVSIDKEKNLEASLITHRKEKRIDVNTHLKLKNSEIELGFCHVYSLKKHNKPINFKLIGVDSSLDIHVEKETHKKEELERIHKKFIINKQTVSLSDIKNKQIKNDETIKKLSHKTEAAKPIDESIVFYIERVGVCDNKVGLIRGWAIDKNSKAKVNIELFSEKSKIKPFEHHRISREDVISNLGAVSDKMCGFSILFDLEGESEIYIELISNDATKRIKFDRLSIDYDEMEYALIDVENINSKEAKKRLVNHLGQDYISHIKRKKSRSLESLNCKVHLDYQLGLDNCSFISGWLITEKSLEGIYFTDGIKLSENLINKIVKTERPDVNEAFKLDNTIKTGFYTNINMAPREHENGLIFMNNEGEISYLKLDFDSPKNNSLDITKKILSYLDVNNVDLSFYLLNHFHPVLQGIWKGQIKLPSEEKTKVTEYGESIKNPKCSVIIPLYGRYDFVLHQIVSFSQDPSFKNFEIIYVNDDPKIENHLHLLCQDIENLYSLPFKVISYGKNLGYAGANNVGARHATSDHLLLLNSDILPKKQGWLANMLDTYNTQKNIGALGTKLVFDDETIQHIGMSFVQSKQFGHLWLNEHPFKGFPNNLTPSFDLKPSPTVTAACLMVSREKFNEVGGFDTSYILGDFEDSDLCLKLLSKGYTNYVSGKDYLYHLERQSQSLVEPGDWKFKLTLYNGWQHTNRWNKTIKELTETSV